MLGNPETNVPAHVSLEGYLKLWRLTDALIITNCFRISRSLYCLSSAGVLLTQSGSFGSSVSVQKIKVGGMEMSGWHRSGAGVGELLAGPGPPARGDVHGQPPPKGSSEPVRGSVCH